MILLWGLDNDSPLQLVRKALLRKKIEHLYLNQAHILDAHICVEHSESIRGVLDANGIRYSLNDFRAFYLRPYDFRDFPQFLELDENSDEWRHATVFEDILWGFVELTPALVLNRPSSMFSNTSKPFQSMLIEKLGFRIPDTLLTTNLEDVLRFKNEHGNVIYKSISGIRSIVNSFEDIHWKRMEDLRWCPTQFQKHIPGIDYRIHVVGERVFTTRVLSDLMDYRYGVASFECAELPIQIRDKCTKLSNILNLDLAGIDLRLTPEGEWYCFEVNPSPAYSVYESATGQIISEAIADLLVTADGKAV